MRTKPSCCFLPQWLINYSSTQRYSKHYSQGIAKSEWWPGCGQIHQIASCSTLRWYSCPVLWIYPQLKLLFYNFCNLLHLQTQMRTLSVTFYQIMLYYAKHLTQLVKLLFFLKGSQTSFWLKTLRFQKVTISLCTEKVLLSHADMTGPKSVVSIQETHLPLDNGEEQVHKHQT